VLLDALHRELAGGDVDAGLRVGERRRTVRGGALIAEAGAALAVRGEVVQLTRQVAYLESTISDTEGQVVSRALGTFIVRRKEP